MSVRVQLPLLVLLILCCSVQSKIERVSLVMDPSEKFNVSWSFDSTAKISSRDVTFTIKCETTGWVGIGLSPNGGMTGADIIIAWVDDSGEGHLQDMHATGKRLPLVDDSQDVTLDLFSEKNGVTTITFTRKVNTCDEDQDIIMETSTTRLIYAYGSTDPVDNVLSSSNYHGSTNRGVRSIYLFEPQTRPEVQPNDIATFDMMISNYSVPSTDTTYYCSFFEPPVLDRKHHIISVEPLVQPGNEALVHHVLIYACWGVEQERIKNNNQTEGVCFTAEMPEFFGSCRSTMFAWAVGGTKYYFPENAGYPIGTDDGSSPDYYMMEFHYDNPDRLSDWVDSSGLRFTYTPTLRANDLATVSVGIVSGIAAPPRPNKFRTVAYCSSDCTNQWIPEEGITIVSYILHSHLLGVGIQVDWYRDGKSLGTLAGDDSYDFNFQETRSFSPEKKVLRGDTLKITCTYSDSDRVGVTYGGLSSREEMCLAFLMYYPRTKISDCQSVPNFVFNPEETLYTELSLNATRKGFSVDISILNEVTDWTDSAVQALQNSYEVSDHTSVCLSIGGQEFPEKFHPIVSASFPKIKKEKDDDFCDPVKPSAGEILHIQLYLLPILFSLLVAKCIW